MGKRDIFFELHLLAKLATRGQCNAIGRELKLTYKIKQQYVEGKGKNKALAAKFFKLLSERWLRDELQEVERLKGLIGETKKKLEELEKATELRSQQAMVTKRCFDLSLMDIPEDTDRLTFLRSYFLESAHLITDCETCNERIADVEKMIANATEKSQSNQSEHNEVSGTKATQ